MAQSSRPISPHLSIYKPQITMIMSIMHRITGMGLALGMVLVTWWLSAAAWGDGALAIVNSVLGHGLGKLVLFLFTWALFHHMLGGIRHFIWDFGHGFSHAARFGLAWFTLIGGFALAAVLWAVVLFA